MLVYDYAGKTVFETERITRDVPGHLFILCRPREVAGLRDVFGFDESTVRNCTDLDESVRYASFDGYDFVSLVHIELYGEDCIQREINLYVSERYLVLVMPEHESLRLESMEKKLMSAASALQERPERINRLYLGVFHTMLADFSDTMEVLEDKMQALSEEMVKQIDEKQFASINMYRNMSYAIKKQVRALSYLGEQIMTDQNSLIIKSQSHHFKSVDTRLKKLYGFAESLYNFGGELLYMYDSRWTMKTNDTVNKLAAITLFFGPLTLISGIYGMNFDIMPELRQPYGYPLVLCAMGLVTIIQYIVLKKKKWL